MILIRVPFYAFDGSKKKMKNSHPFRKIERKEGVAYSTKKAFLLGKSKIKILEEKNNG